MRSYELFLQTNGVLLNSLKHESVLFRFLVFVLLMVMLMLVMFLMMFLVGLVNFVMLLMLP